MAYTPLAGATNVFDSEALTDFKQPLRGHRFLAIFEGADLTSSWKTISGGSDNQGQDAIEYREGGFTYPWSMWYPNGKTNMDSTDLEFEKGMFMGNTIIPDFVKNYFDGTTTTYIPSITIDVFDAYGKEVVAEFVAYKCFPTGYESGMTLDATSADGWMEKLKMKCEWVERKK